GRGLGEGAVQSSHPSAEHRVFASPLARKIAEHAGVDIAALEGARPRGRIVKADVEAAQKSGTAKPVAKAPALAPATQAPATGVAPLADAKLFYNPEHYEEIPHDSMRKTIARR